MSETITASLTVSGGDVITAEINTLARGPAGPAGEGGGGAATWGGITGTLSDQNDLQSALDGKAPASGIAPSAIDGTAVITTDPRLADARTPTSHTHPATAIADSTETGRSLLTAATQFDARTTGLGSGATGDALFQALTPAAARGTLLVPASDPAGVTGADAVSNIISLTQAEYDAIGTKSATTLYVVT